MKQRPPGSDLAPFDQSVAQARPSRFTLTMSAVAGVDLPGDYAREEDLVPASSQPLSSAERLALIRSSVPPARRSGLIDDLALPEDLAQAVAGSRMDPVFDCLNIILLESSEVEQFLRNLLQTGSPALYEDARESLFAQFLHSAQIMLEASDAELARLFCVSTPTIGRWTSGRTAPHPLLRRTLIEGLAEFAAQRSKTNPCEQGAT